MGEDIKFDKRNYRRHNDKNKQLIKKSLEECGAGRSILIDKEGEIIAGNGVYAEASKLNIPVKVIETDGSELIAIKRTDLATDDDKRRQLAVMDNTTSDSSDFDITLLQEDFDIKILQDLGLEIFIGNNDIEIEDDLMNNDELPEMNTGKQLALSKMPLNEYLCIRFNDGITKKEWIESFIKKINPDTDIQEDTQFCGVDFYKKEAIND